MIASFFTYTIFGFGWIFGRISYLGVGQDIALAWRFAISFLVMTAIGLFGRKIKSKGKKWWKLLLLGLLCPTAAFLLEGWGLVLTNASFSSVLVALTPIISLFAAQIFLKETPTLKQVLFAVLSISGVIIITIVGSSMGTVTALGVLALIGTIVATVAFSLLSRTMSKEFTVFERTYGTFFVGTVYFITYALIRYRHDPEALLAPLASPEIMLAILYLGVCSSVIGNLLMNYGLAKLPVARVTVFTNWSTVVSIVASVVFLHESFTLVQVVGSVMILAGLYGVNRFARKEAEPVAEQSAAAVQATS